MFRLESEAGKRQYFTSKAIRQEESFTWRVVSLQFNSHFQLIEWDPSTWERAICFPQSTNTKLNVNIIQKTLSQKYSEKINGLSNIWTTLDTVNMPHIINNQKFSFLFLLWLMDSSLGVYVNYTLFNFLILFFWCSIWSISMIILSICNINISNICLI